MTMLRRRALDLAEVLMVVAVLMIGTAISVLAAHHAYAPRKVTVAGVEATFEPHSGRATVLNTGKGAVTVTIARRMDDDDEAWRDIASFFLDPGETWEGAAPGGQWEVRVSGERTPLATGVTDE